MIASCEMTLRYGTILSHSAGLGRDCKADFDPDWRGIAEVLVTPREA